jgi:hypothetical protein
MVTDDKSDPVKDYLAKIGKKGGQVTGVPKGFATGENARKAAEARWAKEKRAKAKRAAKKTAKKAK